MLSSPPTLGNSSSPLNDNNSFYFILQSYLAHKNADEEISTELIITKAIFGVVMYGFVEALGFNQQ